MIIGVITATAIVGGVGLFIGLFLGVAAIKFKVEVDEREEAVLNALPGNNCGGCGFPGCSGLAAAIAKGEAPVNACPVGGEPVRRIMIIMGLRIAGCLLLCPTEARNPVITVALAMAVVYRSALLMPFM